MSNVPEKCPRCDSPQPHLHPAVQAEGEVQPCPHPWHKLEPNDARWTAHISSPMPANDEGVLTIGKIKAEAEKAQSHLAVGRKTRWA